MVERFWQRRMHAFARARCKHDKRHRPIVGRRIRILVCIARSHDWQLSRSADRRVVIAAGVERGERSGWRARIRTWNKGAKNPCDTLSPPANKPKRTPGNSGVLSATTLIITRTSGHFPAFPDIGTKVTLRHMRRSTYPAERRFMRRIPRRGATLPTAREPRSKPLGVQPDGASATPDERIPGKDPHARGRMPH